MGIGKMKKLKPPKFTESTVPELEEQVTAQKRQLGYSTLLGKAGAGGAKRPARTAPMTLLGRAV